MALWQSFSTLRQKYITGEYDSNKTWTDLLQAENKHSWTEQLFPLITMCIFKDTFWLQFYFTPIWWMVQREQDNLSPSRRHVQALPPPAHTSDPWTRVQGSSALQPNTDTKTCLSTICSTTRSGLNQDAHYWSIPQLLWLLLYLLYNGYPSIWNKDLI